MKNYSVFLLVFKNIVHSSSKLTKIKKTSNDNKLSLKPKDSRYFRCFYTFKYLIDYLVYQIQISFINNFYFNFLWNYCFIRFRILLNVWTMNIKIWNRYYINRTWILNISRYFTILYHCYYNAVYKLLDI